MVAQTTIGGSARPNTLAARATRNASAVLHDVWTLAELQCQLAAADYREGRRRALTALAAGVVGLAVLLAAIPIALVALAELLVTADLSRPAAYGLAALAAVIVATGALWLGWAKIKQAATSFSRSKEELGRNLTALRCLVSSCDD